MTAEFSKNVMDLPGGKTAEYIDSTRASYQASEERLARSEWHSIDPIAKVKPENKNVQEFNPNAQPGELIFRQIFHLKGETGLSREYHEGMEEVIVTPNEESWCGKVRIHLFHPVTQREETIILQNPGDKAIIPPYTIHTTTNLSDERVELVAQGTCTKLGGKTVKDADIKEGEIFNSSSVAITTSTYYPKWTPGQTDLSNQDRTRGYLALGLIKEAAWHGYKVYIAESGSSPEFLHQLRELPNVTIIPLDKPSMGPGKKRAIEVASQTEGTKYIFRIEPEKVDSIRQIADLVEPIVQERADVTIGNRRDTEFAFSYPDYGYKIEIETNRLMNQHLRENGLLAANQPDLDLYSGMIAFRNTSEVVELFTKRFKYVGTEEINPQTLEGWMHAQVYGVVLALHQGLSIVPIEVPFYYAGVQKLNEIHPTNLQGFRDKRLMQQKVGSDGIRLLAETLGGKHTHLVVE